MRVKGLGGGGAALWEVLVSCPALLFQILISPFGKNFRVFREFISLPLALSPTLPPLCPHCLSPPPSPHPSLPFPDPFYWTQRGQRMAPLAAGSSPVTPGQADFG